MSRYLSLSRAARLVGVTRGALQKRISNGELSTFEGLVTPEDLLRVYPQARLDDNTALERFTQIKDNAFGKRVRERILPDAEVLAARLAELGRDLAGARAELDRYQTITQSLQRAIDEHAARAGTDARAALTTVGDWLRAELARVPAPPDHHPLMVRDSFLSVMAAHVQMLPSKHEFFVEGSDTILDAALRAGLALDYGCSNGNCGLCKARIVSGQVKKVRHHDYVLSEADRAAGYTLLCSNTAVTDLVVEAREAGGVGDIPLQRIATRVRRIEPMGADMRLLHLQTPRTNRLRFLAGQYATVAVAGEAVDLPIASCPCDDRNLQFHVHRAAGDAFAEHVFHHLKAGDAVTIEAPKGDFILNEESTRPLIFIAIDAGFAPIKSLIEHAMALDVAESMHLYWVADARITHYLSNLCRAWADALDNFHYVSLDADTDSEHAVAEAVGRVPTEHRDLAEYDVYLAGAGPAVAAAERVLRAHGLPAGQLACGYYR